MEIRPGTKWLDPTDPERKKAMEDDVVTCSACGCQWMELVCVQQYDKNHYVILGQKPPTKNDIGFWIFKCPKCNEVYEPHVYAGPQDIAHKRYQGFVADMMERGAKPKGEGV
jgi:hypothetical protein